MHSIHKESTSNKNSKKEKKFSAYTLSEKEFRKRDNDRSTLIQALVLVGIMSWLGLGWNFSEFPKHVIVSSAVILIALVMLRSTAPDNKNGELN